MLNAFLYQKSACYFQCLEHFNNCSPLSLFTLCLSPIYPLLINFTHYVQQSAFRGVPHQQVISTLIQKADVNASDSTYLLIKLFNSKLYTLCIAKTLRAMGNKVQRSKVFVKELKSYGTLIWSKTLVN